MTRSVLWREFRRRDPLHGVLKWVVYERWVALERADGTRRGMSMGRPAVDMGPRLVPPRDAAGATFSALKTVGHAACTISTLAVGCWIAWCPVGTVASSAQICEHEAGRSMMLVMLETVSL